VYRAEVGETLRSVIDGTSRTTRSNTNTNNSDGNVNGNNTNNNCNGNGTDNEGTAEQDGGDNSAIGPAGESLALDALVENPGFHYRFRGGVSPFHWSEQQIIESGNYMLLTDSQVGRLTVDRRLFLYSVTVEAD